MEREMLHASTIVDAGRLFRVREMRMWLEFARKKMPNGFVALGTNQRGTHRLIETATMLMLPYYATMASIDQMMQELHEVYPTLERDLILKRTEVIAFTQPLVDTLILYDCVPVISVPLATYVV